MADRGGQGRGQSSKTDPDSEVVRAPGPAPITIQNSRLRLVKPYLSYRHPIAFETVDRFVALRKRIILVRNEFYRSNKLVIVIHRSSVPIHCISFCIISPQPNISEAEREKPDVVHPGVRARLGSSISCRACLDHRFTPAHCPDSERAAPLQKLMRTVTQSIPAFSDIANPSATHNFPHAAFCSSVNDYILFLDSSSQAFALQCRRVIDKRAQIRLLPTYQTTSRLR